jgi:ubiquinone biosynthesis protein COQ9
MLQGPVELVEHFIAKCNARMLEELSALDMEHMTLKEKIRAAIHARLRQYAPHIATWPQVCANLPTLPNESVP